MILADLLGSSRPESVGGEEAFESFPISSRGRSAKAKVFSPRRSSSVTISKIFLSCSISPYSEPFRLYYWLSSPPLPRQVRARNGINGIGIVDVCIQYQEVKYRYRDSVFESNGRES
jgi:hypothetical protein